MSVTKDFSQGYSSPLFGMHADAKICYSASKCKGENMSEARFVKYLFDGLSPVRNNAAMVALQQKYNRVVQKEDGKNGNDYDNDVGFGESKEKQRDKENSKPLLKEGPVVNMQVAAIIAVADPCLPIKTPYKFHHQQHTGVEVAANTRQQQQQYSNDTNLLNDMLGISSPSGSPESLDLLATTPATAGATGGKGQGAERTRLMLMTPGDARLLGGEAIANSPSIIIDENTNAISYSPLASTLAAEVVATPATRKVLFALDTPPTPPMPTRTEITPRSADKETNIPAPRTPAKTPVGSPRARQIQSASKQLSSVMEMLSSVSDMAASLALSPRPNRSVRKVMFGSDKKQSPSPNSPNRYTSGITSPTGAETGVRAVGVMRASIPPSELSTCLDKQPTPQPHVLYIKPSSWTPLKKAAAGVRASVGGGCKSTGKKTLMTREDEKENERVGRKSLMGPPVRVSSVRTPSKEIRGIRDTMISHVVSVRLAEEVPSPFRAKTPLKRSPVKQEQEQEESAERGAREKVEIARDDFTATNDVTINAPEMSVIMTEQHLSVLLEQPPMHMLLVPSPTTSANVPLKCIKIQEDAFEMQESPIATSARLRPQPLSYYNSDGDDDDDETVPLADIIKEANALSHEMQVKMPIPKSPPPMRTTRSRSQSRRDE